MFSLIIVLISIVLVAALVIVAVFYGGSLFTKGGVSASAAALLAQGAQIRSAVEVYKGTNGYAPTSLDDLVTAKLLKQTPTTSWSTATDYFVATDVSLDQCKEANRMIGFSGVPACTDSSVTGLTACCSKP